MGRKSKAVGIDPAVAALVGVEATVALVNRTAAWYRELHKRAKASRYLFRGSGVLVLLLSASLPVLAASDYHSNRLVVAGVGSAIGTLTAVSSFYRWGDRWRIYRRAELDLEAALREWEAKIIEGSLAYGAQSLERSTQALAATQHLIEQTKGIVENQHSAFFEALQLSLPQVTGAEPLPDQSVKN